MKKKSKLSKPLVKKAKNAPAETKRSDHKRDFDQLLDDAIFGVKKK